MTMAMTMTIKLQPKKHQCLKNTFTHSLPTPCLNSEIITDDEFEGYNNTHSNDYVLEKEQSHGDEMFANQTAKTAKTAKTHETKNSRFNIDKNSNETDQHMDSSNNQVNDKENDVTDDIGNGLEESKQHFQGKNLGGVESII